MSFWIELYHLFRLKAEALRIIPFKLWLAGTNTCTHQSSKSIALFWSSPKHLLVFVQMHSLSITYKHGHHSHFKQNIFLFLFASRTTYSFSFFLFLMFSLQFSLFLLGRAISDLSVGKSFPVQYLLLFIFYYVNIFFLQMCCSFLHF